LYAQTTLFYKKFFVPEVCGIIRIIGIIADFHCMPLLAAAV